MEKNTIKEYICIHISQWPAVQQKLTQHCKSTILQLKKTEKQSRDFQVYERHYLATYLDNRKVWARCRMCFCLPMSL